MGQDVRAVVFVVSAAMVVAGPSTASCSGDDVGDRGGVDASTPVDATGRETSPAPVDAWFDTPRPVDATMPADAAHDVAAADVGSDTGLDGPAPIDANDAAVPVDASDAGVDAPPLGDSGIVPFQSCAAGGDGLTNCRGGDGGVESCCTSLPVPGGTFFRNYQNNGPPIDGGLDGGPDANADCVHADGACGGPFAEADPATVSGYRFDEFEVTVGRFRQFVSAWGAGWRPADGAGKHTHLYGGHGLVNADADGGVSYEPGWQSADDANVSLSTADLSCGSGPTTYATWTAAPAGNETRPINCVNWYEAHAFCIWDGGFLPSAAEYEFAAAGGDEQRSHPWGYAEAGIDNLYAIYGCYYHPADGDAGSNCLFGVGNIAPVGTPVLGAGKWGQLDLGGNMYEWSLDWGFNPQNNKYFSPCIDCALLTDTGTRVLRDAYFDGVGDSVPVWINVMAPTGRYFGIGVRCARTP